MLRPDRAAAEVVVVVALALLTMVPAAHAQSRVVSAGERVRLSVRGESSPVEGVVFSMTPERWRLSLPDGGVRTLAPEDVAGADVWETRGNALRGALIGGGVGLVAGVLLSAVADDDCRGDTTGLCNVLVDSTTGVVLIWSPVAGAAVGALIGTLVKTGGWVPGLLPQTSPGASGLALNWSLPVGF